MKKILFIILNLAVFMGPKEILADLLGQALVISHISNAARREAVICVDSSCTNIPTNKTIALQQFVQIPFVSLHKYLKQYIKNMPFVPEQALSIQTQAGHFRLWNSEVGVLCAPDPKSNFSAEEWKMASVFKSINKSDILLKLRLLIDKQGNINLI